MLILLRGPNAYELLDRARAAREAGRETGRVPWQVHLGQQRRLDRQVRGWRQRRSVGRVRSKRLEWKELVVPPTRLRRGLLVTDEKGGEVRLERGVEVEAAIVRGLLKHSCLLAWDDGAPAIRRVRRKWFFPARVAECHVVRPIPTDARLGRVRQRRRRTLPVERGRHDAASVPGALTARKEPECLRVHTRRRIARDADRRRRARLDADHHCLVGEVAAHPLSEGAKPCTQAPGNRGREELVKTYRMDAGPVGTCRQVRGGAALGEVDEPLRRRHEASASRGERCVLECLLESDTGENALGSVRRQVVWRHLDHDAPFATPSPRLDGDHPLTTTSSPLVAAGQITPPGHMQNENTPRPSTWRTSAYDAAGNPRGRVGQRYWIWSTSAWGCSTRTPTANGFASSARPRRWRSVSTSRAECPVARITPRPATWSPAAVTTPVTAPLASERSVPRVPKYTSPPQSTMVAWSACTTCGSRFVPTCGCASIRTSGGAPWRTSTSSTSRMEPRFVARV